MFHAQCMLSIFLFRNTSIVASVILSAYIQYAGSTAEVRFVQHVRACGTARS